MCNTMYGEFRLLYKICLLSGIHRYMYWLQRLSVTFYVESFVIGNLHRVLSWLQQLFCIGGSLLCFT